MSTTTSKFNADSSDVAQAVWLACVLEATARKPGNVHPGAEFVDLCYQDFLTSARLIAPVLARTPKFGVGPTVLTAIQRTQAHAKKNTNLGIVLLLTPLAAVEGGRLLQVGLADVLDHLTQADADAVYQAIRLADPSGMDKVDSADITQQPMVTLLHAMQLAAERDTVARQYANGFRAVFDFGLPLLEATADFENHWEEAIIELHLRLMAEIPDTLIARKCGSETALLSSGKAQAVLDVGGTETTQGQELLSEFDSWLRADGHRRNPGTTADLVAACLFAGFREQRIKMPDLTNLQYSNLKYEQST